MKSKEEILDLLDEFGLSRIRGPLESLLLPAVRINLHQVCEPAHYHPLSMTQVFVDNVRVYPPVPAAPAVDTLPIGASKVSGCPDVPADFVWPYDEENEPMEFFAQLNFAEVAALTPLEPLPQSGFFSFFVSTHLDSWHVLHHQGEISELKRVEPESEIFMFGNVLFLPPYSTSFEREWTVPSADTAYETRIFDLSEEERYAYYDFCYRVRYGREAAAGSVDHDDRNYHHHLLGWDDMPYMDGRVECADMSSPNPVLHSGSNLDKETYEEVYGRLAEEGKEWRTLLEISTSFFRGSRWDFGSYPCVFIRNEDLIANDFSRVCVLWDKS